MYVSIDSAVAAIESQIRKNKTRLSKRLRDGALEREVKPSVTYLPDEEEEQDFLITRTKQFPLKPMTPEEAILQMNLLGHEFSCLKIRKTGMPLRFVRAKDGNYGMIEGKTNAAPDSLSSGSKRNVCSLSC
jgi:putative sigma-54 modulation protein